VLWWEPGLLSLSRIKMPTVERLALIEIVSAA
jgi:hypothetical protein